MFFTITIVFDEPMKAKKGTSSDSEKHPAAQIIKDALGPYLSVDIAYPLISRHDDAGSHFVWSLLDDTPYSRGDVALAGWDAKFDKIRGRGGLTENDLNYLGIHEVASENEGESDSELGTSSDSEEPTTSDEEFIYDSSESKDSSEDEDNEKEDEDEVVVKDINGLEFDRAKVSEMAKYFKLSEDEMRALIQGSDCNYN